MSVEVEKYQALLERRLFLLRALAKQFVDCRKEFVSMDLDGMHRRIAEQEELCRQIQLLNPASDVLRQTCASQPGIGWKGVPRLQKASTCELPLRGLMSELRQAQEEVGRLNRIHAAYLRRSGRTIQVLMNFVGNYALSYGRPAEPGRRASQLNVKG